MFAVVRETEVKTEVLFKGTEDECLAFYAESFPPLFNDVDVFVQEME